MREACARCGSPSSALPLRSCETLHNVFNASEPHFLFVKWVHSGFLTGYYKTSMRQCVSSTEHGIWLIQRLVNVICCSCDCCDYYSNRLSYHSASHPDPSLNPGVPGAPQPQCARDTALLPGLFLSSNKAPAFLARVKRWPDLCLCLHTRGPG